MDRARVVQAQLQRGAPRASASRSKALADGGHVHGPGDDHADVGVAHAVAGADGRGAVGAMRQGVRCGVR